MVSIALVAQREVEEIAALADVPFKEERENNPARPDVDQDKQEHDNGGHPKDTTRKKVVQRLVYFVSSLL